MEFRLLGPVELWTEGLRRDLGSPKEHLVLAILLLNPGRLVTTETLIDRVWDADPPAKPRQSLYSYMTRLRVRLGQAGGAELKSRSGGYVLEVDAMTVDLHHFRQLRDQARAIADSGDDEYALELYRTAARLWRAEPLAGMSGDWVVRTRKSIEDELLAATFNRVDIELRHGRHADLVGELSGLVARFPYDERLVERLMRALVGAGRQAEALEVYRRTHARLVQQVGTEPGHDLRDLHQRVLKGDPNLLSASGTRLEIGDPPNTLPRDLGTFQGRRSELRQLVTDLPHQRPASETPRRAVNVLAIDGMPGVGKSALAVHLAHDLASHYPDGQLYLNLHAHDGGTEPLDPTSALGTLLRSFSIPPSRIPPSLDDRIALWRTHLARRRVLIVLDDAAGNDQVLPLLPGSRGCLTIVTSRRRLVGLDDVRSHSLAVLPPKDAVALFSSIVGADRPMDDEELAAVAQRCGHLPLGIQMAAGRLRQHSAWTLADLLRRLPPDGRRLDELRDSDRALTAVFEMSYRELPARHREAFRLFGLHPGSALTAQAAASLVGTDATDAERILDDLHERHLLNELEPGRFSFHDLLRDYAIELAISETSKDERLAAVCRILDFYLAGADRADRLLYPQRRRFDIALVGPAPTLPTVQTKSEAQRWLNTEIDNLIGAAHYAAKHGWAAHTAQFGHALAEHLESRGYWAEGAALHEQAVAAWTELGDQGGMAGALADLSLVRFRSGQYNEALEDAKKALAIRRSVGDRSGEAQMLDHIGIISWHQSEFADALAHCQAALRIWRSLKDRRGVALGLDHSAIYLEYLGRYHEASNARQHALAIYAEVGDLRGRQKALNNMGDLELRLGNVDTALGYYQDAAAVTTEMGRQHEAIWLSNMANIYQHTGRYEDALQGYRKALSTYQELGDRRSEIETLIGIGSTFQQMARYREALVHHQRALALSRAVPERYEATKALRCIGTALLKSGSHAAALDHFQQAYDLAREIGELYETAKALEGIGSVLFHEEDRTAKRYWHHALSLYKRLGVPEIEIVKSYLQGHG